MRASAAFCCCARIGPPGISAVTLAASSSEPARLIATVCASSSISTTFALARVCG
jgi:hypothetical protein